MDYRLDAPPRSFASSSCSIITALDNNSSNRINTWSTEQQFVSLRCCPTLTTLPPELLSKISCNLSLCDYSFLSRTCARLHSHLFHPAELVLFLKTRYRLSIQSGSIIIFAYLANMQVRAPLLLERIFEDFFADSPLRLQEEQKWKQHCQQQRQQLSNNTFQLNQDILSKANNSGSSSDNTQSNSTYSIDNSTSLEYQRMDALEVHKTAEKARRQAKWDAVRMLGVLYALDKTHIGPSSSTNALVLSGACDPPEPTPLAPTPAPATETEADKESEAGAGATSAAIVPASAFSSAFTPAPSAPQPSCSTTTTATTADTDTDECSTPSSMYHVASSSLFASCELSRQHNGQGSSGRSNSLQGHGQQHQQQEQQDLETVSRSRSASLDHSDLAPQYHSPKQYQSAMAQTRNLRKRPSPSIPSKDGKMSSSSSSSSWRDSPLTQQHAHSDSSRLSPPVLRHHHSNHHQHHRQRSPSSFSPSSSSSSPTSVFSLAVPGSRARSSGGACVTIGNDTITTSGGDGQAGVPSPTSPAPSTIASSFPSTSISSLSVSSSSLSVQEDELRQRLADRRNKRNMMLRAAVKERPLVDDQEAMEYVEYQSARSSLSSSSRDRVRRGCWTAVNQDLDFDMDMITPSLQQRERERERERERNRSYYEYNGESDDVLDQTEEDDVPTDADAGYVGSGNGSRGASDADEYMQYDSTAPTPAATSTTKSLSSSSCPLPTAFSATPAHFDLTRNDSSSTSALSLLAGCSSAVFDNKNWSVLREDESAFGSTPLGISVPVIEANTNSSGNDGNYGSGRWQESGSGRVRGGIRGASSTPSSWRVDVPLSSAPSTSSFLFGSQGVPLRFSRENPQALQQKSPTRTVFAAAVATNPTINSNASAAASSTATATTTTGTQQKTQQILNRHDKIAFLTKYTDRMHLRLQALGIEDWGQGDIQRKKTYQLMIQHNDKTGEKDLVKFYLGRYGGSVTSSGSSTDGAGGDAAVQAEAEPVVGAGLLGLPLQQEPQQGQGTPLVGQA
ncbi:hypothetical protein BGW39_011303 [Mortierella sp. 14UC]|nr:hypothetical protein BGW39_011303 [Mortierella sp. 14UC]